MIRVLLILLLCISATRATTITAIDAEYWSVSNAISQSVDGDIVNIPAGVVHWTNTLYITKAISLIGAGTNTGSTLTSIQCDVTNVTFAADGTYLADTLIFFNTQSNKCYRLSSILIPNATTRTTDTGVGIILIKGYSTCMRVDHCFFNGFVHCTRTMTWYTVLGLIDHCSFYFPNRACDFYGKNYGGADYDYGDGSWYLPSTLGTTNTAMMEDCYFESSSGTTAFTDSFDGARYAVRHSIILNGHLDSHEGGSRTRATRQTEVYANSITVNVDTGFGLYSRGGCSLVFSNVLTGTMPALQLNDYRMFVVFAPWGGRSGTNVWDENLPTVYYSGTNITVGISTTTIEASGNPNWTTNQWVGYTVQNTMDYATNAFGHRYSVITANTTNTLTFYPWLQENVTNLFFLENDTFKIYFVTNGLDQPGVGSGDKLSGEVPTPVGWPHQAIEPCYEWGNTGTWNNNGQDKHVQASPTIRTNFHYFANTPKPGYTPLVYPHPMITAQDALPPVTITNVYTQTIRVGP